MACPRCHTCLQILNVLEINGLLRDHFVKKSDQDKREYKECLIREDGFNVFEENTFPGLKGGDCLCCMEHTKTVMVCCEQPVCKKCFVKWFGNEEKRNCMHCRGKINFT